MIDTQFIKNRFCILGAAKSGISAALLLKQYGCDVFVSEFNKIDENDKNLLSENKIPYEENGHNVNQLYQNFDVFVVSPGISPNTPIVQNVRLNNITVISEIDLALKFIHPEVKLIGITGTNGKSTTTHYLTHILNSGGLSAFACGNIGTPLSEIVRRHKDYQALCIELSSYQLEYGLLRLFDASIFLNLQNDHLARHKTQENYLKAKWTLITQTKSEGISVIDNDVYTFAQTLQLPQPGCKKITQFEEKTTPLCLPGIHNAKNIGAANIVAEHLGVTKPIILCESQASTSSYRSLPHRLETIATSLPQIFINDSKATNVESTLVALNSLKKPIHLLLGGQPKGDSYHPLADFMNDNIQCVYPFGESGIKVYSELKNHKDKLLKPFQTMIAACEAALLNCKPGEVILLSPACSSFDEFKNFEHRGDIFKEWVKNITLPKQ